MANKLLFPFPDAEGNDNVLYDVDDHEVKGILESNSSSDDNKSTIENSTTIGGISEKELFDIDSNSKQQLNDIVDVDKNCDEESTEESLNAEKSSVVGNEAEDELDDKVDENLIDLNVTENSILPGIGLRRLFSRRQIPLESESKSKERDSVEGNKKNNDGNELSSKTDNTEEDGNDVKEKSNPRRNIFGRRVLNTSSVRKSDESQDEKSESNSDGEDCDLIDLHDEPSTRRNIFGMKLFNNFDNKKSQEKEKNESELDSYGEDDEELLIDLHDDNNTRKPRAALRNIFSWKVKANDEQKNYDSNIEDDKNDDRSDDESGSSGSFVNKNDVSDDESDDDSFSTEDNSKDDNKETTKNISKMGKAEKQTKTYVMSNKIPSNRDANRVQHVKRFSKGVSRFMPNVFQNEDKQKDEDKREQQKYVADKDLSRSNQKSFFKMDGFGNGPQSELEETTYKLDNILDVDRPDDYASGTVEQDSSKKLTFTKGKFEEDLHFQQQIMARSEKDEPFLIRLNNRLTNKIDSFLEQNPEIMQFIDGPEGEDNRGFYRCIAFMNDDSDPDPEPKPEPKPEPEPQIKPTNSPKEKTMDQDASTDLDYWRGLAQKYIVRINDLEQSIASKEKIWEEKVQVLQSELDQVLAKSDESSTSESTEKLSLSNDKDLMTFEDESAELTTKASMADNHESEESTGDLIKLNDSFEVNSEKSAILESAIDIQGQDGHAVASELTPDEVKRYSRQLLISDGFGVLGQKKLLASKVLVVGAGGIGSTVLPYLAAAGVGSITIVDHDDVETSNLHRQIIHSENTLSSNKAVSACKAINALNSSVKCTVVEDYFNPSNALDLAASHDVVVDATDNPKTRYLINDACVLSGSTPLVSGSAMGTEGQMTVYNYGENGCCYRCLYPKANSTEGCKSCSENGVLGPVPGLIGILQAMEVIKILTGVGSTMHDRLIMYDSMRCSFLNIKKPPAKKSSCPLCGPNPSIRSMSDSVKASQDARGPSGMPEIEEQAPKPTIITDLPSHLDVTCQEFDKLRKSGNVPHVLVDVRVPRQYEICAMDDSINIPLAELESRIGEVKELSDNWNKKIFCICRRGIFSAEATRIINKAVLTDTGIDCESIFNIRGGLTAWVKEVDPDIPMY